MLDRASCVIRTYVLYPQGEPLFGISLFFVRVSNSAFPTCAAPSKEALRLAENSYFASF